MTAPRFITGRGVASNPANRYASAHSEFEPDHPPSVVTEVRAEQAKSIIARNRSPDLPFAQSINPYQGCEHGCVYCFARPTHAYWDLSPGLDFETRLSYKANAAALLERELSRPGYRCRPIALGSNTDPYQPLEREQQITRQLLEVLQRFRHPFTLTTKSQLVLRDLDILAPMAAQRLCRVHISVTTLDNTLKRRLEPRTASPKARLQTIRDLNAAGVPVGVLAAPVIPSINDAELEAILAASHDAGACSAAYILIRLPHEVKGLFRDWLQAHYPGRARHVISLIEQCRGGQLYDPRFGQRMTGSGVVATLLAKRFEVACRRLGLTVGEGGGLDCNLFGDEQRCQQLSFF
ncbi:PA0069 family radical SAM protein [Motiliproteus sediminis]|uniref:PA0069 family radical SAM protein n=1 Tax=Motiliproteus sediminis TaxID=1468178 RepID=UPI001AEFBCEF|nr:PA0069 family radical SAM protein [Motiliproteus sediminis]